MAQKQDLKAALDLSLKREEEYQTLFDEMKRVLDDAGEWRQRGTALYPSLADLLDDKLGMLTSNNGHHQ